MKSDGIKDTERPSRVILNLSLPALERLLGGNTELEISARQQIVESFCRRYLKTIANSEATRNTLEAIRRTIGDSVSKIVREVAEEKLGVTVEGSWKKVEISDEFKKKIREVADSTVRSVCAELI